MLESEIDVGRGGSGYVVRTKKPKIVEKIFHSGSLEKIIQTFFFGAPNCDADEDAVQTAYYRRKVLSYLVEYWFGDKLRVAKPEYVEHDEKEAAFKLGMEFIKGRAPKLLSPFQHDRSELTDLVETMKTLQEHLDEAGFVGTLWQAGKGNPVALNNFLLEDDTDNDYKWVMVDCESGVPPYVPISLKAFWYYIKQSVKLRKFLFDDVDIDKLARYVPERKEQIVDKLGMERYNSLLKNIVNLRIYQNRWKSKTRVERGINYYLKKEKLTKKQEELYRGHQNTWYIWLSGEYATTIEKNLYEKSMKIASKAFNFLLDLNLRQVFRGIGTTFRFIFSHEYKAEIGRDYARRRISKWKEKRRLDEQQASLLEEQVKSNVFADYFADLGVHAVIWPIGKVLDVIAGSYLLMTGHPYLAAVIVGYGTTPFLRVTYTAGRLMQSYINGKEKPGWAFIGILPQAGNLAYPIQMTVSAAKGNKEFPMFLIVDEANKIGEKLPIIGGADTLTEHKFNHLGYRLGRYFGRRNNPKKPSHL